VLPKQSNPPNNGSCTSVLTGSAGERESSGVLTAEEIEALHRLFILLDQWDRGEADHGE
jgi:hypothetical protein